MSIDPEKLDRQRLSIVPRAETVCNRCGKRTTDKTGTCRACRAAALPDIEALSVEQLSAVMTACHDELRKRRDAIRALLRVRR